MLLCQVLLAFFSSNSSDFHKCRYIQMSKHLSGYIHPHVLGSLLSDFVSRGSLRSVWRHLGHENKQLKSAQCQCTVSVVNGEAHFYGLAFGCYFRQISRHWCRLWLDHRLAPSGVEWCNYANKSPHSISSHHVYSKRLSMMFTVCLITSGIYSTRIIPADINTGPFIVTPLYVENIYMHM